MANAESVEIAVPLEQKSRFGIIVTYPLDAVEVFANALKVDAKELL
jgi:hypothetical protein